MKRTALKVIIGIVSISSIVAIVVVVLALSIFLVYHDEAVRAGNEAATIQNLKTIAAVEIHYYRTHTRAFGTFEQLVNEQMLSRKFANSVNVDGYILTLIAVPETREIPASYTVRADPFSRKEGRKHFYLDSVLREINVNSDKPAGPNDPIVNQ